MAYSAEFGVAIAVFVVAMTTLESDGRELRPSEHGLVYNQDFSPASEPAESKSFFAGAGGGGTSPAGVGRRGAAEGDELERHVVVGRSERRYRKRKSASSSSS
ncbi:hypothetical protein M0R45_013741 [Rubus argutus]|uniref:Uncharacterized protein n=1 Tax=Rubus argutus TaxID=59490 RepID=A0AAW1XKN8_RUBAR